VQDTPASLRAQMLGDKLVGRQMIGQQINRATDDWANALIGLHTTDDWVKDGWVTDVWAMNQLRNRLMGDKNSSNKDLEKHVGVYCMFQK